jgi:putative ABC transport system permease protein
MAFALYGLALGSAEGFRRAALLHHTNIGPEFLKGAIAASAVGMLLILFLVAGAMAQVVRLRLYELGMLKALGFSHRRIIALITAEASAPCLAGAILGLIAAKLLSMLLAALLQSTAMPPLTYTPGIIGAAFAAAGLIALLSAAIPASRIVRLNAATALMAGGPWAPKRASVGAPPEMFPTEQISITASKPYVVTSADLHLLRQIIVVTRIGLLTLRQRLRGALMIAVSVGCVISAMLSVLSIVEGIRVGLLDSGDPSRVVLHHAASWINHSSLPEGIVRIVANAPGVARAANGTPLAETESFGTIGTFGQIGGLTKRNNGEPGNTTIVGAGPLWPGMTPSFQLLEGRLPRPGTRELMAGDLARRKFSALDSGMVQYKGYSWRIVGTFTTRSWWDGYLVGDAAALKHYVGDLGNSIVLARLTSPQAFREFARALAGNLPPDIIVDREPDYYDGIWKIVPDNFFIVAYVLGGLIGCGTMAAIAQIMHGAVEERGREIAVLRALGFDVRAIATSVLLEGVLLAVLGALAGFAAVWLWQSGFLYNGAGTIFRVTVDVHLLLVSLAWALAIAFCGTIPPAVRLTRQRTIHTLEQL